MTPAAYVVVRYVADSVRNEPLNIGIVAWTDERFVLILDKAALSRVVSVHPSLPTDGLVGLDEVLLDRLEVEEPFDAERFARKLRALNRLPYSICEPLSVTMSNQQRPDLDAVVADLVRQIVTPRRRRGGTSFAEFVAQQLRPLIATRRVSLGYAITGGRSGVVRRVDFFANSGADVALDAVRFATSREADITRRADATAYKIDDLLRSEQVREYLVLGEFASDPRLKETNDAARRIIESAGGQVVQEIERAVELMREAATAR